MRGIGVGCCFGTWPCYVLALVGLGLLLHIDLWISELLRWVWYGSCGLGMVLGISFLRHGFGEPGFMGRKLREQRFN